MGTVLRRLVDGLVWRCDVHGRLAIVVAVDEHARQLSLPQLEGTGVGLGADGHAVGLKVAEELVPPLGHGLSAEADQHGLELVAHHEGVLVEQGDDDDVTEVAVRRLRDVEADLEGAVLLVFLDAIAEGRVAQAEGQPVVERIEGDRVVESRGRHGHTSLLVTQSSIAKKRRKVKLFC